MPPKFAANTEILSRQTRLNQLCQIIDRGMPSCALVLARDLGIQFDVGTIASWYRIRKKGSPVGHRRTYAALFFLERGGPLPGRYPRQKRRREI